MNLGQFIFAVIVFAVATCVLNVLVEDIHALLKSVIRLVPDRRKE